MYFLKSVGKYLHRGAWHSHCTLLAASCHSGRQKDGGQGTKEKEGMQANTGSGDYVRTRALRLSVSLCLSLLFLISLSLYSKKKKRQHKRINGDIREGKKSAKQCWWKGESLGRMWRGMTCHSSCLWLNEQICRAKHYFLWMHYAINLTTMLIWQCCDKEVLVNSQESLYIFVGICTKRFQLQ